MKVFLWELPEDRKLPIRGRGPSLSTLRVMRYNCDYQVDRKKPIMGQLWKCVARLVPIQDIFDKYVNRVGL